MGKIFDYFNRNNVQPMGSKNQKNLLKLNPLKNK